MNHQLQSARYADFKSREDFSPRSVYRHDGQNSRYIPIHAFADEAAALKRLNISADSCQSVDAWWAIENDATLVQAYTSTYFPQRLPGLYARQTDNDLGYVYLTAVIECGSITRSVFETALSRFIELGFPNDAKFAGIPCGDTIQFPMADNA